MNNTAITLKPSYWASISGGKDSLYMLNIILKNPQLYPLDGFVYFDLDIDFPFVKDVIAYAQSVCKTIGVPFFSIKPDHPWDYYYNLYGFPSRGARWCNSKYKLSAKRNLEKFLNSRGFYLVSYIGFCADEVSRFSKYHKPFDIPINSFTPTSRFTEVYPLAEFGINEDFILAWARTHPIFNNYYLFNKRCGCMGCPLASLTNHAYLLKFYPEYYYKFLNCATHTEDTYFLNTGKRFSIYDGKSKYDSRYRHNVIINKYLPRLEEELEKLKLL